MSLPIAFLSAPSCVHNCIYTYPFVAKSWSKTNRAQPIGYFLIQKYDSTLLEIHAFLIFSSFYMIELLKFSYSSAMCRHGFGRVSSTTAPLVLILTGQVQQAGEGKGSILLGINVAMPVLLGSPVPNAVAKCRCWWCGSCVYHKMGKIRVSEISWRCGKVVVTMSYPSG